jgi:hypothetical protein
MNAIARAVARWCDGMTTVHKVECLTIGAKQSVTRMPSGDTICMKRHLWPLRRCCLFWRVAAMTARARSICATGWGRSPGKACPNDVLVRGESSGGVQDG